MPFDAMNYAEAKPSHDLSTQRGRLLYLRDTVVPGIPAAELDLAMWDCGTTACLAGWAMRDRKINLAGLAMHHKSTDPTFRDRLGFDALRDFFGITQGAARHLFDPYGYGHTFSSCRPGLVSHAELRTHIDDVLEGRVQ